MAAPRTAEAARDAVRAVEAVPARVIPEPPPARLRRCSVLDEVPGLGAELASGARAVARRVATAAVVILVPGEAPLQRWFGSSLHGPGLLVLGGLLARE